MTDNKEYQPEFANFDRDNIIAEVADGSSKIDKKVEKLKETKAELVAEAEKFPNSEFIKKSLQKTNKKLAQAIVQQHILANTKLV